MRLLTPNPFIFMLFLCFLGVASTIASHKAYADFSASLNKKSPITLEAGNNNGGGIEWNRGAQTYTASGGVTASQGTLTLSADSLSARYNNKQDITKIMATRGTSPVTAIDGKAKATARKVLYTPLKQYIKLFGDGISLTTPQHSLKTNGTVEYWQRQNKILITGRPIINKGTTRFRADTVTVFLKNIGTSVEVDRARAEGNVQINTPNEQLSGNTATYSAATQTASIDGDVLIKRDGSQLSGSSASVNIATGISTLKNTTTGGRVRGVLQLPE